MKPQGHLLECLKIIYKSMLQCIHQIGIQKLVPVTFSDFNDLRLELHQDVLCPINTHEYDLIEPTILDGKRHKKFHVSLSIRKLKMELRPSSAALTTGTLLVFVITFPFVYTSSFIRQRSSPPCLL